MWSVVCFAYGAVLEDRGIKTFFEKKEKRNLDRKGRVWERPKPTMRYDIAAILRGQLKIAFYRNVSWCTVVYIHRAIELCHSLLPFGAMPGSQMPSLL